jgi:hypothetical protein
LKRRLVMSRKLWLKGTLLLLTGTTLAFLGGGGGSAGCWSGIVQRILVAVAVD